MQKNLSTSNNTSSNNQRYKTELCRPYTEWSYCKYGTKCQFAHGVMELRSVTRHPKYKTELCRTFHTHGLCPYGHRCHFIHNLNEQDDNNSSLTTSTLNGNNHNSSSTFLTMSSGNNNSGGLSSNSGFSSPWESSENSSQGSISPVSNENNNIVTVFNHWQLFNDS